MILYSRKNWSEVIKSKAWRRQMLFVAMVATGWVLALPYFMQYIQNRSGRILPDYLLAIIPAADVSFFLFAVIYAMIFITIIYAIPRPMLLIIGAQSYLLLLGARMLCIYLFPLDPPSEMQTLVDPLIDGFIGSSGTPITKDLFFSGHTATAYLLYLLMDHKYLKPLFLAGTLMVAAMLLIQHVHYTIDVLTAPLFAFGSFRAIRWWQGGLLR